VCWKKDFDEIDIMIKSLFLRPYTALSLLSKEGEEVFYAFFQMQIQLHIIEPLFMFVTMFPFSKVGYMHLATRFHSKANHWQQCSF
jgi:hypothetical protein